MTDSDHLRILIRADAGGALGTGHVTRMLALAQALQDETGAAIIASAQCPEPLVARLASENVDFVALPEVIAGSAEDADATLLLAKKLGCQWIVLDGYHFDDNYQKRIFGKGPGILCVDDYGHSSRWHCDAVLNHNLYAPSMAYDFPEGEGSTLLGSRFGLLRREFLAPPTAKDENHPLRNILITLGGVDPENATGWILQLLGQIPAPALRIRVIVGAGNPHRGELENHVSHHFVEILEPVSDMPSQFIWADGVISAGGGTCLEWLRFQLPALVVTIADNQEPVVAALAKHHLAVTLGWPSSSNKRETISTVTRWLEQGKGPSLSTAAAFSIDGYGAHRVACFLNQCALMFRPATPQDVDLYFQWANDPDVRRSAFTEGEIPWENHVKWFQSKLTNPDVLLWICEHPIEGPVGQVRLESIGNQRYSLDYSLAPAFRGRKIAPRMLSQALRKLEKLKGASGVEVVAQVKSWNEASLRTLRGAGFGAEQPASSEGQSVIGMSWSPSIPPQEPLS